MYVIDMKYFHTPRRRIDRRETIYRHCCAPLVEKISFEKSSGGVCYRDECFTTVVVVNHQGAEIKYPSGRSDR